MGRALEPLYKTLFLKGDIGAYLDSLPDDENKTMARDAVRYAMNSLEKNHTRQITR